MLATYIRLFKIASVVLGDPDWPMRHAEAHQNLRHRFTWIAQELPPGIEYCTRLLQIMYKQVSDMAAVPAGTGDAVEAEAAYRAQYDDLFAQHVAAQGVQEEWADRKSVV